MHKPDMSNLQLISVRWWNANAYYAIILAKILHDSNNHTVVGGTPGSPALSKAKEYKLSVIENLRFESSHPLHFFQNIKRLKQVISEQQSKFINPHRPEDHLYTGITRSWFPDIPVVRWIGDVRSPKRNPVNKWLHLSATDHFIFSCKANKDRYQDVWPIPEEKASVIYAPIDLDYFHPKFSKSSLREKLGIREEEMVFGMVGRLSPVKDHKNFLIAASKILGKSDTVRFLISGDEVEITQKELQDFSRELGISESIIFLDKQEDVREVLGVIDIGVICSNGSEAISRIGSEYLAMGKPVIVTDINVLPEMISNEIDGFIVRPNSPEEMSRKMLNFVSNTNLVKKMGKSARKSAENRFGFQKFLRETLTVYQNILNKEKN